jgi:oligo-1,6-glucosidase
MMRWWLDRGVDGFRMDVINLISKPVRPDGSLPDGDAGALSADGPRVHEFLQEMHREVLAGRDLITVGETPGASVADARLYSDPARRELDMVFTFEHVGLDAGATKWDLVPLRLTDLKANLGAWQEGLAEAGWNSLYWDNHDQPRIVSRWGDDGEHALAVKSRDNARTPVQWDASPHAGFTTGEPWLTVNPNHTEINAVAVVADPGSVFHHHRTLITLRHELPVVVHGDDYRLLLPDDEQVFAYLRTLDGVTLLVVANLSGEPATVDLGPDAGLLDGELLLGTHPAGAPAGELRPWESRVLLTS